MPTITVRISDDEKKRLLKHGELSKSVREAIELYLNSRRSQELIEKLGELQKKNAIRTLPTEEVKMIDQDRRR
jgi:hypothetical protein